MKHLHEIKGRFAVRVVVAPELRGIIGRAELREWLGRDRKVAERNAHAVVARFLAEIDGARDKLAADAPTIRTAARGHYGAELLADDRERGAGGTAKLRSLTTPLRASRLRLLAAGQIDADEGEALMGWAADYLVETGKAPADVDRAALLKGLAAAQLEALARFEERDQGKVTLSPPTTSILADDDAPIAKTSSTKKVNGPTLDELLVDFHRERMAGNRTLSAKTMSEHKVAVRMLGEYLGATTPARSITRTDMLAYKRALMETPTNYRQRFPGKSLPEAIALNDASKEPYPTLNPQTINEKWLSHVSTIMGWCANNGLLDDNPARGIKVDEGKGYREPTRVPFSKDDLARIFGHAMFTDPSTYGTRQWALLVALYTGARSSSEIARIKLSDIYQEQGVWVFDLEEATKNLHSKRLVPVHRKLLELGLLAYVEQLRLAGAERLFPDWAPEHKINRWFLRTFKAEIGITDKRKVFHSFRHSLKTALALHGVNRDVSDMITGHKDQSVGGVYIGDASVTMVKAMKEGIDRVEFDLHTQ
jgi:site-specific recombinase XerD